MHLYPAPDNRGEQSAIFKNFIFPLALTAEEASCRRLNKTIVIGQVGLPKPKVIVLFHLPCFCHEDISFKFIISNIWFNFCGCHTLYDVIHDKLCARGQWYPQLDITLEYCEPIKSTYCKFGHEDASDASFWSAGDASDQLSDSEWTTDEENAARPQPSRHYDDDDHKSSSNDDDGQGMTIVSNNSYKSDYSVISIKEIY